MTKDTQTQINEAIEEQARERVDAVHRAIAQLGLDDDDHGVYDVVNDLYDKAFRSGRDWEQRYPR